MDITFPNYLNDDAFKYRHLKIKVMQNKEKSANAVESFETLAKKSELIAGAIQEGKLLDTDIVTDSSSWAKRATGTAQRMNKIWDDGSVAIHNITLPLPNSLVDASTHDWSADTGLLKELTGALESSVAGKALGVASQMSSMRKPLADPGYFQNYTGTLPREFALSFDLIPANIEEAANIHTILTVLRKYSSPSASTGTGIILAPHYFKIEFTNPYVQTLVRADGVVLKSISVDYGADGAMQQTPDGIPKHMKLDLVFADRQMMTEEMY